MTACRTPKVHRLVPMKTYFFLFFFIFTLEATAKPFRKALVIGGGGVTPGVALGMIAGAKAAGYHPDVIITTCGASLGAALYSSFSSTGEALKYARSQAFHRKLQELTHLNSYFAFGLRKKMKWTFENPNAIPPIFTDTILEIPRDVSGILPQEKFPTAKNKSKLIVVAARALFGPDDQKKVSTQKYSFKETYFTDAQTARHLGEQVSAVHELFPFSRVSPLTETATPPLSVAVRASITDPFYINPVKWDGSYFWGGAINLFPLETAQSLADEVLVNFPVGLYSHYEDLAIYSTFGFAQSDRTQSASRKTDVKWMDGSGTASLAMDPTLFGFLFNEMVPDNYDAYSALIQKQYRFGYQRAVEAVQLQRQRNDVRSHLRNTLVGAK